MPSIPNPDAELPIINNEGLMTDIFQSWVVRMTNLDLMVGTGSPEGIIVSEVGREYLDTNGSAGSVKFIKQKADIAGDRSKGWVAV